MTEEKGWPLESYAILKKKICRNLMGKKKKKTANFGLKKKQKKNYPPELIEN